MQTLRYVLWDILGAKMFLPVDLQNTYLNSR